MRISDWSSDVCASDLDEAHQEGGPRYLELDHEVADAGEGEGQPHVEEALVIGIGADHRKEEDHGKQQADTDAGQARENRDEAEIGRASCRERVCQYV